MITFALSSHFTWAQNVYIPDVNFNRCLIQYDLNRDGKISLSEAEKVTAIICDNEGIESLIGIKAFTNLTALVCNNNKLKKIPDLSSLTKLRSLNCSRNELKELPLLPTSIESLNFYINQITGLANLTDLNNINYLNGSSNLIKSIPPLSSTLKYLRFSNNLIEEFPDISNLKKLTSFVCEYNKITIIPGLSKLTNIEFLKLNNNQFKSLPDLSSLSNLASFDFGYNFIENFPKLPKFIKYLYFTMNNLDTDDCAEIRAITYGNPRNYFNSTQREIELDCYYITFKDEIFEQYILSNYDYSSDGKIHVDEVDNVQSLDISALNITDITGIDAFVELVSLECNDNQLTYIPHIPVLTKLKFIRCENNQITSLPDLSGLFALKGLYCSDNKLSYLPDLNNLSNLQIVECNNNQIKQIPNISQTPVLHWLYFNNNQIDSLPAAAALNNLYEFEVMFNNLQTDDCSEIDDLQLQMGASFVLNPQNAGSIDCFNQIKLYADYLNSNELFLSWVGGNESERELLYYRLYFAEINNDSKTNSYSLLTETKKTSYTIQGLDNTKNYSFKVESIYSDETVGYIESLNITALSDAQNHHLRFPHVAQNNQWWTGLVVVNPNNNSVDIDFKAIDSNGNHIASSPVLLNLQAGQKTVNIVSHYFDQDVLDQTSWIDLESNDKLLGFELFGQGFNNMSGVIVNGNILHHGYIPISDDRSDRYVAMSLINTSDTLDSLVTLKGYSSNGAETITHSFNILPQNKMAKTAKDLFAEHWSDEIHSASWSATTP